MAKTYLGVAISQPKTSWIVGRSIVNGKNCITVLVNDSEYGWHVLEDSKFAKSDGKTNGLYKIHLYC